MKTNQDLFIIEIININQDLTYYLTEIIITSDYKVSPELTTRQHEAQPLTENQCKNAYLLLLNEYIRNYNHLVLEIKAI